MWKPIDPIIKEVWVTKYVLSKGILHFKNVKNCLYHNYATHTSSDQKMIDVGRIGYFHDNDWHLSEEAAQARAQEMTCAKIKTLTKQLDKLEKNRGVDFPIVEGK